MSNCYGPQRPLSQNRPPRGNPEPHEEISRGICGAFKELDPVRAEAQVSPRARAARSAGIVAVR